MNAADKKILDLYKEIFSIRKTCGKKRQKKHFGDFESLEKSLLDTVKEVHPYDLTISQIRDLEKLVANYGIGGGGLPATINVDGFLYRIANFIDVYANTQAYYLPERLPELASELWWELRNLSNSGKDWLPLSEHGEMPYKTNCQISWWTQCELDDLNNNFIEKANKLGLFENWIYDHFYLLKCRAEICINKGIASVPTIIDAFASSVFYTTDTVKKPIEGTTINLSETPDLKLGISEFVLKEIDLGYIEIKPLEIEPAHRQSSAHITSWNLPMIERLKSFYQNLP